MLRAHKHWLPVIIWMGFIFTMSTSLGTSEHTSLIIEPVIKWLKPDITPEHLDLVHLVIRKCGHLTEYAILGWLLLRALKRSRPAISQAKAVGIALLIAAAYASTDEYHQTFVPGRTPAVHDVVIDTTGAFLALAAASLQGKRKSRQG